MNKGFAIAIDGPVASGKGTLAPSLARKLKGFYLDTGAMYRCVALYSIQQNIDPNNKNVIEKLCREIEISFKDSSTFMDGKDVSEKIRTSDVSRISPVIAGFGGVREELIKKQKEITRQELDSGKIVVVEGRDIATIVLPDAEFKLYLTASVEARAKRRQMQLAGQGEKIDLEKVLQDTNERDKKDMEINKTLVKNPKEHGYHVLDNSGMTQDETLDSALDLLRKKGLI
jgi:cytidylate kinase